MRLILLLPFDVVLVLEQVFAAKEDADTMAAKMPNGFRAVDIVPDGAYEIPGVLFNAK